MVSRKLGIIAIGGALAAMALTGCAPKGTANNNNGYGAAGDNPALAAGTPTPSTSPTPAAAPVGDLTNDLKAVTIAKMGKVVTDSKGWVLYRFDKDTAKPSKSNCVDKCAQVWPPALTDGNPSLTGVDAALVGTITRADGGVQITLNGWPLYRYIGDPKPGAWKGQNVGGVWFVVANDGKKNLTCLPTPAPTAVQPPAASAEPTADGNGGTGGY